MPGILSLAQGVLLRATSPCKVYFQGFCDSYISSYVTHRTFASSCRSCLVGFISHVITSRRKEGAAVRVVPSVCRPLDDIFCRLFSAPLDTRHAKTRAATATM